ncbi:hypothetical protein DIPPA_13654 [Diplonema papillatum]|nr:hypothetical protein DIPPA_13654 [Diplonema papillatum]
MGNQSGKYFEETHQLQHLRFELRALIQTTDGAFEKCVVPNFAASETTEKMVEDERRCSLEYIRTRLAYNNKFRMMFEQKLRESFEASEKKKAAGNPAAPRDSEAAILRIRRKEPGDPVAGVVGEYEQSLRWGKGHSDNAYINGADEAATRALQERLPALDVELLYRENGVRAVCCYAAEDFPQLESPIRYVKRVWQYSRTKTATRSIRELASAETTKGSTLRSLETLPGAVDLLQAIIRRAVMPRATRVACKRCAALANAQHVLLADDATHNEVSDIRHAYPADPPHLKGLLADYAKKRRDTIRHVAKRVKVLCDDPLAARWSSLVLRYIE